MKTIMERCAELRASLEQLKQAQDDKAKAEELERRRTELQKSRVELSGVVATALVLINHEHLAASGLPDCARALESCDKVETLLAEDPTSITRGRDYATLLNRVGKVREGLEGANHKSWQAVKSQHQGVDESFLRRVEVFPRQGNTVSRIRELKAEYEEATRQIPVSEDAYARFEARYAALQHEVEKLDPATFPDEVLRFFRHAQRASGAPLTLFTDSVRAWIEQNGFLDGVRVRFTGED